MLLQSFKVNMDIPPTALFQHIQQFNVYFKFLYLPYIHALIVFRQFSDIYDRPVIKSS